MENKKKNTKKIILITVGVLVALLFLCCGASLLRGDVRKSFQEGVNKGYNDSK